MASGPLGHLSATAVEERRAAIADINASHHRGDELLPALREHEVQSALITNSTKCGVALVNATERMRILGQDFSVLRLQSSTLEAEREQTVGALLVRTRLECRTSVTSLSSSGVARPSAGTTYAVASALAAVAASPASPPF